MKPILDFISFHHNQKNISIVAERIGKTLFIVLSKNDKLKKKIGNFLQNYLNDS